MSYALADALQAAVFARLSGDAGLNAVVQGAVHDALPAGALPETYVMLGPETVIDRSDMDGEGAEHRFVVSVHSSASGFANAKRAAMAVSAALHHADLPLSQGRLIYLNFERAVAKRDTTAGQRRIDLRFRARVENDQP